MDGIPQLVSELVRAANETEKLTGIDVSRLLDRAIATIVEMRAQIGIVPIIGRDALIYPQTVAAGALKVPREEWHHGLLHAAEMVRDLYIVLDSEVSIEIKVPSEAEFGQ